MINKNHSNKKKVVVAMSGGVDSSLTAAILKKRGYKVIGVFINFGSYCEKSNTESAKSAKNVAEIIGIPLHILDVKEKFKEKVINYFLEELEKGKTPNPCVVCNKEIKFKILLKKMLSLKADYAATGHYAQIQYDLENYHLSKAKDKTKDQSYFLYRLNQKQLSRILFPLGDYTKTEVRKMAKRMKLPVYDKKESQDICFIPEKGYENFLAKMLKPKKGKILDLKGSVLGTHRGLPFYTLGQRKGIELGGKGPYYVIRKNFKRNEIIVTNKKEDVELFSQKILIKKVNWIEKDLKFPLKALVRTRYRNPLVGAIIRSAGSKCEVELEEPQRAVTSGQSAVFYSTKGDVIGGGTIV
jgi:tRNA-specific 2-thiouridylase